MTETATKVDAAADELYGLPPGDFIGRRRELSRQAKADGASDAAKQIGALRRPTTSAWVANLLARERLEEITALLDLGAAMEDAQQSRSGNRLRSLAGDRRQQLDALVHAGLALADRAGQSARGALPTELRETLEAALGQSSVGEQLRSGRLNTAHRPGAVGFGDWSVPDASGARSKAKATAASAPSTQGDTASSGSRSTRSASARQSASKAAVSERLAAHRRLRDAENAAAEQRQALDKAEQQVASDQATLEDLSKRLAELDEQRDRLRAERTGATNALRTRERSRDRAAKENATAQRALDKARRSAAD